MISNDSYTDPVLTNSQYEQGMQNKKMERQAVKGLTPKYCYARLSTGQSITQNISTPISFDTYSTNDARMDKTAGAIIIPQTGLWVINAVSSLTSLAATKEASLLMVFNGIPTSAGLIVQQTSIKGTSYVNITNLGITLFLNQGDVITLEITHNDTTSRTLNSDYTTLRAISYILY